MEVIHCIQGIVLSMLAHKKKPSLHHVQGVLWYIHLHARGSPGVSLDSPSASVRSELFPVKRMDVVALEACSVACSNSPGSRRLSIMCDAITVDNLKEGCVVLVSRRDDHKIELTRW